EKHHAKPGLKTDFIRAAQGKRGVMGLVLSAGEVRVGDTVLAYPPVK
ncbi:MOSC domain-containing protein, partial [Candidatus Poribacteria bacterium]|nr:MOSC domain-containing protein [Candidatus Poribacteria bacterium]